MDCLCSPLAALKPGREETPAATQTGVSSPQWVHWGKHYDPMQLQCGLFMQVAQRAQSREQRGDVGGNFSRWGSLVTQCTCSVRYMLDCICHGGWKKRVVNVSAVLSTLLSHFKFHLFKDYNIQFLVVALKCFTAYWKVFFSVTKTTILKTLILQHIHRHLLYIPPSCAPLSSTLNIDVFS